MDKNRVIVEGHKGIWYVVSEVEADGETFFLLEHHFFGEDADWIAIDENGKLIMEEITDGAEELIERLEEERGERFKKAFQKY